MTRTGGTVDDPPGPPSWWRRANHGWARNIEVTQLFDAFLVSAVGALLGVRFYLFLTGYPKVGGGGLHVAHLLWGGGLMLVAILLQLVFLTHRVRWASAIVGGLGFGLFIDELGKFLTSDNNYFFRPTAALIYVVFVLLFLAMRSLQRYRGFSTREYVANAIELLKEVAIHDLDEVEKRHALVLLSRADANDAFAARLKQLIADLDALPSTPPTRATRTRLMLERWYADVVEERWFQRTVMAFFAAQAVLTVVEIVAVLALVDSAWTSPSKDALEGLAGSVSVVGWIELGATFAGGLLVALGLALLRERRITAYRLLEGSLLISIFVTQPLAFYEVQFVAVFLLGFNMVLFSTLGYLLRREGMMAAAGNQEPAGASITLPSPR